MAGTLVLAGGDNRLPETTIVTLGDGDGGSGVLQLGEGTVQTIGGLVSANDGGDNRVVGGGADVATLSLAVNGENTPSQFYFYGILGGSGQYEDNLKLALEGDGEEGLYSASTYTGGTALDAGTLWVGHDNALGIGGAITPDGGTLVGFGTLGNPIVAADGTQSWIGSQDPGLTLNGDITGSGTITAVPYSAGVLRLGGDNEGFTGTFSEASYCQTYLTQDNAGSANAAWQVSNSRLASDLPDDGTICFGALSGSGGTLLNASESHVVTFRIGGENQPADVFHGVIAGDAVAVTKVGTGRLTLSGANTYTGVTTIESGTLEIKNATAIDNLLDSSKSAGVNDTGGFLVLNYASGADPAGTVLNLLTAAYNAGANAFQAGQIRDTSATTFIGLGWVDSPTINGQTYSYQIWIMPALYGDVTLDGAVDGYDLTKLLGNYTKTGMVWTGGDFTYNGVVDGYDLTKLIVNYGQTGPLDINDAP